MIIAIDRLVEDDNKLLQLASFAEALGHVALGQLVKPMLEGKEGSGIPGVQLQVDLLQALESSFRVVKLSRCW